MRAGEHVTAGAEVVEVEADRMEQNNDAWKDRPWRGPWKLSKRTFGAYHHWSEWWFRVAGWGLSMRDHRRIPPLFSERYAGQHGVRRRRYIHVGPFCLATFKRGDLR